MKLNEAFPGKFLKAADLGGSDRLMSIAGYSMESIEADKPDKPVLTFTGTDQSLVLNKTNGNTIAEFLGDDLDDWIGKQVVLYPAKAGFQGKMVDCIRVRQPKQGAAVKEEPPNADIPPINDKEEPPF